MPRRLLILGGTTEGAALARALDGTPDLELITSLAGRTRDAAGLPGRVVSGGFSALGGLARFLRQEAVDLLVDATHPYAPRITRQAQEAANATGVPWLRLDRPPWTAQAGDDWRPVHDVRAAARKLGELGVTRVFLAIGRQELTAFAEDPARRFLVRLVDAPQAPLPLADCEVEVARGPFALADETTLLRRHGIEALVSKNSGGTATYPKIAAARELGLPVVMIERPAAPDAPTVHDAAAAEAWVRERLA